MKFSVVIPLYNKEKYILDCIQSVLNQTLPPSEIIIVNDGSTDASYEIVKSIDSPLIKVIDQENQGPSASRNLGFKLANEELVAFLDADDQWHPEFLEKIYKMVREFDNASIFGSSYFNTNKKKHRKATHSYVKTQKQSWLIENYFEINMKDFIPNMSSVCVRKSDFSSEVFNPSVEYHEDVDFFLNHICSHNIAITSEPLSFICSHDNKRRSVASISGKKLPDYENYLDKFKHIPHANDFINLQRFKYLIRAKLTRDFKSASSLKKEIDFSKISFLKRVLASTPSNLILYFYKLKMMYRNIFLWW